MMRIGKVAFAAALAVFAVAASASEVRALGAPDAAAVIKERQDGMKASGGKLRAIGGVVQAGGDVKTVAADAADIAAWAKKLPTLFPAGSEEGSKALPTVWTDRTGFDAKAAAFVDASSKLAAAAAAGDTPGAAAAFGDVRKSCGGCHTGYKQPSPPPAAAPASAPSN